MNNNSNPMTDTKSQIKYLRQSALREYQMYKQILHESILSDESSDITLSQQSNFDKSFKKADEQVSSVSLYHDIPQKLLIEPETKHRQPDLLYGQASRFTLFDSIVCDPELADLEIQELRKNKMLNQQIQTLLQLKHSKETRLRQLQSRKKAQAKVKQQANKIYAQLDLKTQKLKTHFDKQTWYKQSNQTIKKRDQVLDMVNSEMKRQKLQRQTKIYDLKNRKQALQYKLKYTRQDIKRLEKEIIQRREDKKQELKKEKIEKQKQQIQNLQKSISKMNEILGRTQ